MHCFLFGTLQQCQLPTQGRCKERESSPNAGWKMQDIFEHQMQLYIREQNKTEVQLTKNNDDNDDDCDQVKLINWTAGVQMKRWAIGLIERDDE